MNRALNWLLLGHGAERMGFYLVLDLIAIYLNEKLGYSTTSAQFLTGVISGVAYVGPIAGGVMSDKVGRKQALAVGAAALAMSYVSFAVAAPLLLAVFLLMIGNGLYKPSATAICGAIADQKNKTAAFYKLYIATNVGALLAPVVGEFARTTLGWPAAFACAGGAAGLTALIARSRLLQSAADVAPAQSDQQCDDIKLIASEKTLYVMYAAAAIFWTVFNQFNGSLTFYARDVIDRHFMSYVIPPTVFSGLNSMFVIMLGDKVPKFFTKIGLSFRRQLVIGMLTIAMGFLSVLISVMSAEPGHASMIPIIVIYFAMTVAELVISPAIMTLIGHAAPHKKLAQHMGFWFGSNAVGHFASGAIGALRAPLGYSGLFMTLIGLSVVGAYIMHKAGTGISESK